MRRREWIAGAIGSAALGGSSGLASTPAGKSTDQALSEFLGLDARETFRQAMRIQRSLYDEDDILHWYHFIMVAVPKGASPRPVVRWEGIEFSRHERIGEYQYRMHGHNLSFPRDLRSGVFVEDVLNPLTRERVRVPPMALVEDPGLIRSVEGVVSLDAPEQPPRPEYRVLRRENGFIKIDGIRVPPESWPATFLEMGTEAARLIDFEDVSQLWLPTEVSGAYVFPWPTWMRMGDAPGHMFAAWSGCKLRSVDQLPHEFRQRAERDFPQLLKVDRKPFSRPWQRN